jgi:hypothetical protein
MGKDASEISEPQVSLREQVGEQIGEARDRIVDGIQNPLGLAIGAAAVGFLVGVLVPVTPVEEQALPRVRDKLGDQIKAVDLMERAGRVIDETKRAAVHAVQEEARDASETLNSRSEGTSGA